MNVLKYDYDILILVETWLNDSIFDCEFLDARYNIFRRDRSSTSSSLYKKEGGGVCIAVNKNIKVTRKIKWESECEDVWLTLSSGDADGTEPFLNICAVYIPPPVNQDYLKTFLSSVTKAISSMTNTSTAIIFGDFNLTNIIWEYDEHLSAYIPLPCNNTTDNIFMDEMQFNNLYQCNHVRNNNNRILDLILTDSPTRLKISECLSPLTNLDVHHPALEINFNMIQVERSLKSNRTPRLNFNKSDYQKINKEIATVNWWDRWKDMDVEEMVGDFYTILNSIIEMYTPYSRPHNEKYPNWFTIPLIKCTREKLKFHKKYKKYGNPRDKDTFNLLRNRYDNMLKECYKIFKENAANTIRFQPKKIWSFVKSQKSNNLSIPNQMHLDDRVAAGGQEIADLFSEYFQSVYTLHKNYIAGDCDPVLEENIDNVFNMGLPYMSLKNEIKCEHFEMVITKAKLNIKMDEEIN
ncbi:unnamed protein product [Euphydryas editha]|uniref:Endonuclease/exonuclease/phosphatase domain-containing protein n=1 Tax=Euphydryas editha TaxID=104508 RepID=A0AAU9TS50_EUPED|nr:unnamed protein product [Euphydryas editha]